MRPLLTGFLTPYPDVQVELSTDEGYVDIVERGFDAGVRMGEVSRRTWLPCPSEARSPLRSLGRQTISGVTRFHGIPPTWRNTTACDSGSRAAVPSSSGSSMSTVGESTFPGFYLYLPEQTAAAFQDAGLRGLLAGAFQQALSLGIQSPQSRRSLTDDSSITPANHRRQIWNWTALPVE